MLAVGTGPRHRRVPEGRRHGSRHVPGGEAAGRARRGRQRVERCRSDGAAFRGAVGRQPGQDTSPTKGATLDVKDRQGRTPLDVALGVGVRGRAGGPAPVRDSTVALLADAKLIGGSSGKTCRRTPRQSRLTQR